MGLKLVMCFLSMSSGTMIGYYLYKKEVTREKYFTSIINLCDSLVADIRFSQRTIAILIENHLNERVSPLGDNLKEYLSYIGQKNHEFAISRGCLKPLELEDVKNFFRLLGTSDSQTQVFEIDNYKAKFIHYKELQSNYVQKHAKNYVRLGFLFGLALGILLM